ncbi:succinate-semialdehyde dehydrogenase/glutarate-semialdehyde dehydrogenase [Azospirillum agricola]|uniref:NAD-dependent succinate-semialdehyde dehydrogenase n=1 Tax=Azospirillum agricola TaxID=1720247 RepID=UPI001AE6C6F4|nr:NAD-dependent succinate-semialdehyde dehydrogenase [Azospirillum agricola]MBP2229585.1 succinate-semialdehyde dehydrogenase/glutarate-semialdehyde dehydrogenase [Azospirillum agricola]
MAHHAYGDPAFFIDGDWLAPPDAARAPVLNPATGETLARVPLATAADLDAALDSARQGFQVWRRVPAYDRARLLRRAAELIRERLEHIALVLTLEQGKPLVEARAEVNGSADMFEWFADEGRRACGRVIPARQRGGRLTALREPVGPVAAFTPWNFPAITPARKIAAALAAGCSCILKPAEETPATALELARALDDAGLPLGVLNVVFGEPAEVAERLIRSPVVRKVSFTGSAAVGARIAGLAAEGVKPVIMELGGHAPVVVCEDVDAEAVAALSVAAKFRNAGQICISPTRFLVHETVFDRFVARFAEGARALAVGDGRDPAVQVGPLANRRRIDAMEHLIGDARDHGARLVAGGNRIPGPGLFFQPTLLADVPVEAAAMSVEPFGPLALVNRVSSLDEALREANRLPQGLAAYAFTRSARRAADLSDGLESGLVGLNSYGIAFAEAPFGGVKESGYGSEGGAEGLDAYLVTKTVAELPPELPVE